MKALSANAKLSIKLFLGLLFCVSAILKTASIDRFELYIFSFQIFNLDLSAWLARLVIAAEMCLGLGFICNLYHKFFRLAYWLMLGGFSLFLLYVMYIGREDNCHCFGELVAFKPWQSLLKNVVFMLMLIPIKKVDAYHLPSSFHLPSSLHLPSTWKRMVFLAIVAISFLGIFIYTPPDHLYVRFHHEEKTFDESKFYTMTQDSAFLHTNLSEGKKVVGMYSTGCQYCLLASQKMAMFQSRNSDIQLVNIFWGNANHIDKFYQESHSPHFPYVLVSPIVFLEITENMPVILFLENGHIQQIYTYREVTEELLRDFFGEAEVQ